MGVVAEGASPYMQRPVDKFTGLPDPFAGMTGEADLLDLRDGKPDPPGLDELLVTAEALLVDRGAVLPGSLVDDVAMTGGTGNLFLQPHRVDGPGLL
jgi:hypothetical protein